MTSMSVTPAALRALADPKGAGVIIWRRKSCSLRYRALLCSQSSNLRARKSLGVVDVLGNIPRPHVLANGRTGTTLLGVSDELLWATFLTPPRPSHYSGYSPGRSAHLTTSTSSR